MDTSRVLKFAVKDLMKSKRLFNAVKALRNKYITPAWKPDPSEIIFFIWNDHKYPFLVEAAAGLKLTKKSAYMTFCVVDSKYRRKKLHSSLIKAREEFIVRNMVGKIKYINTVCSRKNYKSLNSLFSNGFTIYKYPNDNFFDLRKRIDATCL